MKRFTVKCGKIHIKTYVGKHTMAGLSHYFDNSVTYCPYENKTHLHFYFLYVYAMKRNKLFCCVLERYVVKVILFVFFE